MMFIIALAHSFAWSGDVAFVRRHWDVARRIMDWARDYGDRDGDGYFEYQTRSAEGTKNQGWKDSGNAILYEDGTPVPACRLHREWRCRCPSSLGSSCPPRSGSDTRSSRRRRDHRSRVPNP